jgi:hypothetical protein
MRHTADTDHPFDTDNRAWQRLLAVSSEHLETVTWSRADGRPVMLSFYDLATGDGFTVAVLDPIEARDAYALLVLHHDDTLAVHGPFDGPTAAARHAPTLAMTDQSVAATLPLPLHHPGAGDLPPDDAWAPLQHLPAITDAALPQGTHTALVLLDRPRQRLAVVGPFPDRAAALRWAPTPFPPDAGIDATVAVLHLAPMPAGGGDE